MEISGAIRQGTALPEPARLNRPPAPGLRRSDTAVPNTRPGGEPAGSAVEGASRGIAKALSERVADNARSGSRIRIDDATERVVVQILNQENEVIKQIPPDDLLQALKRFRQVTGILFDRQV